MSLVNITWTPREFQKTLAKAVHSGVVTKRKLAKEFDMTVRTIERWIDGTRRPQLKLMEQLVMHFVRRRLKKHKV